MDQSGMVQGSFCFSRRWNLTIVARFKLHLRPKTQSALHVSNKIPLLPPNKTAVDVFADFLRYLYQCTRTYIQDTHAFGNELWRSLSVSADFVLTHPNGWEGAQQSQMRKAAVMAGLISDTEGGHARLSFVTEGEASLHFCVQSGLTASVMKVSFASMQLYQVMLKQLIIGPRKRRAC
jgi:hypothetical protein